jgi:hypothetical protein
LDSRRALRAQTTSGGRRARAVGANAGAGGRKKVS